MQGVVLAAARGSNGAGVYAVRRDVSEVRLLYAHRRAASAAERRHEEVGIEAAAAGAMIIGETPKEVVVAHRHPGEMMQWAAREERC